MSNGAFVKGLYEAAGRGDGEWHLRDGQVVRFQQYTDIKQWTDVVG
jgi:hypothetical protein